MELTLSSIKKTKIGLWFKKTWIWNTIKQSQGDWRFPFMVFAWAICRRISPRKRVCVDGVSFTLPCSNWITHFRWYLFKTKEQEVRNYIDQYVKEGDVFFDIGANIGVFSLYAGKCYQDISIYSFEPEHSNLGLLKENIICNELTNKIMIYSAAIGDFDGPTQFHIQDFTPGAAEHSEDEKSLATTREGHQVVWSEGVMSLTMDRVCEHLGKVPNVLKIDTDSNEDKVLKGAEQTLKNKALRSIILEMPNDSGKVLYCKKMLKEAGFKVDWSYPDQTRNEIWVRESL